MSEQQQINYQDMIDLGAKRINSHDTVWEHQRGTPYFVLDLKIAKDVIANWDVTTRTVEVLRVNKEGDILARYPVRNLTHLKQLMAVFGKGGAR